MRQLFWSCITYVLTNWVWLRDKIIVSAMTRPMAVQLHGYMNRWWFIPRTKWLPFAVRLHLIHRADRAPHCHDHPGTFRTIILRGWYVEYREQEGKWYTRMEGSTAIMPRGQFHTISEVSPNGCLTLVIAYGWAKNRGQWGFNRDGEFVNHEDYFEDR